MQKMEFYCSECGKRESVDTFEIQCSCGGLWKLDFEKKPFDLSLIDKKQWSMFRYRNFMALADNSWETLTMGEGLTSVIRFNEDVLLKMDYYMPTLSFKDRGAAVLVSHCKAIGVKKVLQDSSGNAGNAVASYCARGGIECEIFVPQGTSPKKIDLIKASGATCTVVKGSRDECARECLNKVKQQGVYYASHVYNPFFYEGTKTYIYEVYEQLGRIPENLVIPVGNGTLFLGALQALEHLLESECIKKMPNIIAVQSENCDPLLQANKNGSDSPVAVNVKPTLAEGISIGIPKRGKQILEYAKKYKVNFVHAPEDEIPKARTRLAKKGIYCEYTTAANFAGYENYVRKNGKCPDVLIPICGAGLKSDH